MKLQTATRLGLYAVLELARDPESTLSSADLAERFGVSSHHLAKVLRDFVEPWEHVLLNEIAPFDDLNPTAENLARVVADGIAEKVDDGRARVARVEVWENDQCCATYLRY